MFWSAPYQVVALRQNWRFIEIWKKLENRKNIKVVGLFIWIHRDEDSREEKNRTRIEQSDWSSQNGAQPEWSRVDPRVRSPICIDWVFWWNWCCNHYQSYLYRIDNNYNYKNMVQGFSNYIIVSLPTTIYFLVVN